MVLNKLFDIKELAQEFMNAPKIEQNGEDVVLKYDYETDSGEYEWTGITFLNTIKYRHTKDSNISEYMMKAYNAVAELKDSVWINEVIPNSNKENTDIQFKHYLVYFDGYGAYEFISASVNQGIK